MIASQADYQSSNRIYLLVLSVQYQGGDGVTIQEVYRAPLEAPCRALFICKDVVGVIPYAGDEANLSITAINYITNASVRVSVDLGHAVVRSIGSFLINVLNETVIEQFSLRLLFCRGRHAIHHHR